MYYEKVLSDKIIKTSYKIYDYFGNGFLEKVYENALMAEFNKRKIEAKNQIPINIFYEDIQVGQYFADILVENKILLELKVCKKIEPIHKAQLLYYLKATNIKVGYLINFGNEYNLEFIRFVN